MKKLAKILAGTLAVIAALALILVAVILVRADRRFDAPYPQVHATNDPAMIARGEYIAHGPGHCINCHTLNAESKSIAKGATPPMAGGHVWELPFGKVYSANLTPDVKTGIGSWSEQMFLDIFRKGRHLGGDGRGVLPPMPWLWIRNLTDDDLKAIYAYLQTIPPVQNAVPSPKVPEQAIWQLRDQLDRLAAELPQEPWAAAKR